MAKQTKKDLFLELAQPDRDGFCDPVAIDRFTGKYAPLVMGNGGDWCRDDGALASIFNVRRIKEKNKIVAVELHGFKKNPIKKPIPRTIKDKIKAERCVLLGVGSVEVDHKDGRRDDPRLTDLDQVTLDDFQPLSKAANNAKRQHCKTCRETGKRFDAKQLGYNISQVKGNGEYRGSCIGCYWHDPKYFNSRLIINDES